MRQGTPGDQGDGAYSSGRGGAGNIGSPGLKPKKDEGDGDVVPEAAIRQEEPHKTYHVGRGGEGNVVPKTATKPPEPHDPNHPGLKGMVKERLFGGERKRGE